MAGGVSPGLEALAIREKELDPGHPEIGLTLYNLAGVYERSNAILRRRRRTVAAWPSSAQPSNQGTGDGPWWSASSPSSCASKAGKRKPDSSKYGSRTAFRAGGGSR